jgi:hypothetical protein
VVRLAASILAAVLSDIATFPGSINVTYGPQKGWINKPASVQVPIPPPDGDEAKEGPMHICDYKAHRAGCKCFHGRYNSFNHDGNERI